MKEVGTMKQTKHCIELINKKQKGKRKNNVFKIWKEEQYVDFYGMVNELSKRTHLPRWICERVYEAEDTILEDLGILTTKK